MPCIWSIVHHQPSAASPKRSAISPSRVRAAASARPTPGPGATLCADASTASGGPGELGGREARTARVLDPEGVDPGSRRLRDRQVRRDGVEHALEADRLPVLLPEGDDVLDLEVDGVADADAVSDAVVVDLDRRALDAHKLPHERRQPLHRSTQLAAEDLDELVRLLVGRLIVDEDAEPPVSVGHDLRRICDGDDLAARDVGTFDLALADLERERDAAVVVRGAVVEGRIAGTDQIAGARLDIAPLQAPGHSPPPRIETGRSDSRRAADSASSRSLGRRVAAALRIWPWPSSCTPW